MRTRLLSPLVTCGFLTCVALPVKVAEVAPSAKNITIYSAGGSVVSGTAAAPSSDILKIRLPATAQGIAIVQNDQPLKWFTTQMISEPGKDPNTVQKYLQVGIPAARTGEVRFSYGLPEIKWAPRLTASILDNKNVNLRLEAAITMNATETFKNCSVTLVLNNAVSLEKITGHTFNLSLTELAPGRNVAYNLESKNVSYSLLREWRTYGSKDVVHVLMQTRNPFSVDLSQTGFAVESHQISIESGSIDEPVPPGELFSLDAGIDDSITTFRDIKITETPSKKPLPFNHKLTYRITNNSDQTKVLRLVSDRVTGVDHRSIYHFTREPDATPEKTLVWLVTLKPHSTETLQYDYDADLREVAGETGFESGM